MNEGDGGLLCPGNDFPFWVHILPAKEQTYPLHTCEEEA